MYNPTHYYVRVSRAETFTGRSLASQAGALASQASALTSWVQLTVVMEGGPRPAPPLPTVGTAGDQGRPTG